MTIVRAVPDVPSQDIEATKAFYADLLGFDVSMEVGDFLLFSSPTAPDVQVSVNETPAGVLVYPGFMVDVGSGERVRSLYEQARARGLEVFEPIDDKPWGIRRFGMKDPNGIRVTVLSHID
jgi:catechol 2,3-dioxygenase-like lactoylglutathione lyase family enzyme